MTDIEAVFQEIEKIEEMGGTWLSFDASMVLSFTDDELVDAINSIDDPSDVQLVGAVDGSILPNISDVSGKAKKRKALKVVPIEEKIFSPKKKPTKRMIGVEDRFAASTQLTLEHAAKITLEREAYRMKREEKQKKIVTKATEKKKRIEAKAAEKEKRMEAKAAEKKKRMEAKASERQNRIEAYHLLRDSMRL